MANAEKLQWVEVNGCLVSVRMANYFAGHVSPHRREIARHKRHLPDAEVDRLVSMSGLPPDEQAALENQLLHTGMVGFADCGHGSADAAFWMHT